MTTLAYEIVRSLGVFRDRGIVVGAICVGLAHHCFYEVFDQLGPQLRWWKWNTDNPIKNPLFTSVPLTDRPKDQQRSSIWRIWPDLADRGRGSPGTPTDAAESTAVEPAFLSTDSLDASLSGLDVRVPPAVAWTPVYDDSRDHDDGR